MLDILYSHGITLLPMTSDTLKVILSSTYQDGDKKVELMTYEKLFTTQKS